MRTQKVRVAHKKPAFPKPRKPLRVEIAASARKEIAKAINHDWRKLAVDAIEDFREIAEMTTDTVRSVALNAVYQLERRRDKLAGQLEMFGGE